MNANAERILVVESDPDVSDLVARQTLQASGYQVSVAGDASAAIKLAVQQAPDLIIANLSLPGLSGKDLLVAFSSQGINVPFIVIAQKGNEAGVIQSFRLGAADYIAWPSREPEILAVVERVLRQGRERHERQKLDQQLKQTNEELQRRVRELTTIFSIGRAVLSITDQRLLFDKLVEASLSVTMADMGWLLIRDEKTKQFLLVSSQKLPEGWSKKLNQPFDDGVSGLVALSGESLTIDGNPLKQFKVAALGQAVLVAPIKVQNQVIGLLTTLRRTDKPFGKGEQTLLEAVADYASISMVNAQLFRALSQSAEAAQAGEKRKLDNLNTLRHQLLSQVQTAGYPLDLMLSGRLGAFTPEQLQALRSMQAALKQMFVLISQPNTQPVNPQGS